MNSPSSKKYFTKHKHDVREAKEQERISSLVRNILDLKCIFVSFNNLEQKAILYQQTQKSSFSSFNLSNIGFWDFGIPCLKWPLQTRPLPRAVRLTGKADPICRGGSLKTDHYHTTSDGQNENVLKNTTDGSLREPLFSSLTFFVLIQLNKMFFSKRKNITSHV